MKILSESEKTVHFSIADDPKEAVKYDADGWKLSFEFDPVEGKMLKLTKKQTEQLHAENKKRYMLLVKMLADEEADAQTDEEDKVLQGLAVSAYGGTAKRKLAVQGLDTEKWQYWWERPDNLENALEKGFTVVKGTEAETLRNKKQKGKTHTVGPGGSPELVLLKRPREVQKQDMAKRKERADRVRGAASHVDGFRDPELDKMDSRRRSQVQLGPIPKDD
jgi:hypothetical protein